MSEQLLPGGKGIDVSIVLDHLGHENAALGFVGGFTGRKIEARLKPIGCGVELIHVRDGDSRIDIKMKSAKET